MMLSFSMRSYSFVLAVAPNPTNIAVQVMKNRPTLNDVAHLAGVSKSTAARVVNGLHDSVRPETRDRVLTAVRKLGYERNAIAGSLRSERTYMVALSIPDITNPFWPEVVRGVQDTLVGAGYRVVLMNNDRNASLEEQHIRQMYQKLFDGFIMVPTSTQNAGLMPLGVPVVLLASGESFPDFDTVDSDSVQAGRLAIEHLLELGHRRIGLIRGVSRRRNLHLYRDTYIRVLKSQHVPIDPSLIIETTFSHGGGFEAMNQLLALPRPPTAVFAVNDVMALGALHAAQQAGARVPEEISIVGMDDIFAASTASPALTTIAKPRYHIGTTAARFLLERIQQQPIQDARHPQIPCTLVLRNSTRPPP
jgi:DNA-binding LacI/PurR family transcriptional regulator